MRGYLILLFALVVFQLAVPVFAQHPSDNGSEAAPDEPTDGGEGAEQGDQPPPKPEPEIPIHSYIWEIRPRMFPGTQRSRHSFELSASYGQVWRIHDNRGTPFWLAEDGIYAFARLRASASSGAFERAALTASFGLTGLQRYKGSAALLGLQSVVEFEVGPVHYWGISTGPAPAAPIPSASDLTGIRYGVRAQIPWIFTPFVEWHSDDLGHIRVRQTTFGVMPFLPFTPSIGYRWTSVSGGSQHAAWFIGWEWGWAA